MPDTNNYAPVPLIKRLLAFIYDLLLLTAIFFSLGILMSTLTTFIVNDGHAITEGHPFYLINQIIMLSTLFLSGFIFYGWFWTHGGQTLGMKTWRIQLISSKKGNISWKQAVVRYLIALLSWCTLGLAFLWSLFDSKKRCWHDILSSSYLVQLEKK